MYCKFTIQRLSFLIGITCFFSVNDVIAQSNVSEKQLLQQYDEAVTDSEKVFRLNPLISFYYAFNFENKADSLRELQIITAEETRSESLMQFALFPIYYNCVNPNSSNARFQKELDFANQALEFAKSIND